MILFSKLIIFFQVSEPLNDHWVGGPQRDTGPVASKWEHLPLASELLRSLSKFG